ncbi:MAG: hypothetical protein H8E32_05285 [Nitrospinae bacterium]|nr:hypothetical protein [Nitrospinota bacterium]
MQEEPSPEPKILFLLMGASNLARGYSLLTRHLSKCLGAGNSEFLNALGPGRGFCARGGMFNFTYPPIQDCRVMEAAEKKTKHTRAVLITDIGNDLMYGVTADVLIECLDTLIDRMLQWEAEIFLTSIHVDMKKDVSPATFFILRFIFYPASKVTYEETDSFIVKVNSYLEEKTRKNEKVHLITGMESYAGSDKIHYSLLKTHQAWSQVIEEILRVLNIPEKNTPRLIDGVISILANLKRLIFCDIFRWTKKGRDFF